MQLCMSAVGLEKGLVTMQVGARALERGVILQCNRTRQAYVKMAGTASRVSALQRPVRAAVHLSVEERATHSNSGAAVNPRPEKNAVLQFVKYHGLGNDFLLVDNRDSETPKITPEQAIALCDRNFGVGGDGVIFVLPGNNGSDYAMRIYNSDGSEPEAINPLELASEALKEIQTRFYKDYPAHPEEARYGFATPSTMKPTQWTYPGGGVNQIPAECLIAGDCRITPFYSVADVAKTLQGYVVDINSNITALDVRGPVSKYVLPDENIRGRLTLDFDDMMTSGVACNLDSPGFHALSDATEKVIGFVKPYSITGSLPCIRELQEEGFDVQTVGYGLMSTYHARNEYCLLSDLKKGFKVLTNVIALLEE